VRFTIKLPHLGDTTREVVILSWEVELGGTVQAGANLLTVETDKTTTEVPSPVEGVLVEYLVREGDEVAVGAPIGIIETQ
jgi:pyruvate/2-oxoglutarate dehydrogenase complex dihydrolipoamide acyltransferase (E2) component